MVSFVLFLNSSEWYLRSKYTQKDDWIFRSLENRFDTREIERVEIKRVARVSFLPPTWVSLHSPRVAEDCWKEGGERQSRGEKFLFPSFLVTRPIVCSLPIPRSEPFVWVGAKIADTFRPTTRSFGKKISGQVCLRPEIFPEKIGKLCQKEKSKERIGNFRFSSKNQRFSIQKKIPILKWRRIKCLKNIPSCLVVSFKFFRSYRGILADIRIWV